MQFFATSARGLEPLLALELTALGADEVRETRAGVSFSGELALAYRACLWSRLANRILMPLASFPAATPEALYAGVQTLDWSEHLAPTGSLAVDFTSSRSSITHTHFGALKVKDAIVDQFRDRSGERPSVELERPDIRVNVYVFHDEATLSLDLSGDSLHRRGYRERGVPAPLKENLAAAILLRADWPRIAAEDGALLDPMCGSGTFPIEAARMAGDVAPGLQRTYFGFLRWRQYDDETWKALVDEALERQEAGLARLPPIVGYDADAQAVRVALGNVERAGLHGRVHIERRSFEDARPVGEQPGLLVVNPPYGERLGQAQTLIPLYGQIGTRLKQDFPGWRGAVFTGNPELGMRVGLKPTKSYQLFNGPIECRLSLFDIHAQPAETAEPASAGGEMFANRLRKNLKKLSSWVEREGIACYRVYDADLPEYALAVDLYQGEQRWVHVQEYAAPKTVDPAKAGKRLREALAVLPEALGIAPDRLFYKMRQRQKGTSQYERLGERGRFYEVREHGARLLVNFTDYLDTGLFLDHRPTRRRLQELAPGKRFLNLFCYTGAASVHAALGGARATTSVDMSRTYLDWAERNLRLNGFDGRDHELVQADCLDWLVQQTDTAWPRKYDLIFLDPPTFSNSKRMRGDFDVQRDHVRLLQLTAKLLTADGLLVFSNNYRGFKIDAEAMPELEIKDVTRASIPPDFERNTHIHRCFEIRRRP